jgi:hypothetical protein
MMAQPTMIGNMQNATIQMGVNFSYDKMFIFVIPIHKLQ